MDILTVIAENLADADRLLADGLTLRRAHLADLAEALVGMEGDAPTEEGLPPLYSELGERIAAATDEDLSPRLYGNLSLLTRIELCRALSAKRPRGEIPLYEAQTSTVAYFRNPYAGQILQRVTDLLPGCEAVAAEDYTDACEGVADGRYDFCIIPVESAGDGVMNRFVQLIDRCGLFTVLRCHLELSEEEYIRFDLLAASPCALPGADRLQIKVVTGEEELWEFLFACRNFGGRLWGCRMMSGTQDEESYHLTVDVQQADRGALSYFMELGRSRSTVTGYFKTLTMPLGARQGILD